jgi:hypothetical protein
MTCHTTPFTISGVYCCNSTNSMSANSECQVNIAAPPVCLPDTHICDDATGGGCCPTGLICSPNGCIQIKGPSTIESPPSDPTSTGQSTVTVIESPASTATLAKEAEIAQQEIRSGSKDSVDWSFCVPFFSAWLLVCVAGLMGML